jgi:ribonuclease J
MVRLFPETMNFPGEVRTGELYLDGNILCTPDESGVKGRRRLMFGGHIVVSLCIDSRGQLADAVQMAVEGLPEVEDDEESISDLIRRTINGTLKSIPPKRRADIELVNSALQRAIRSEVANYWGKKPNVAVFVHGV